LLQVLRAEDFVVTSGANLGDGLTEAAELMPDDVYGLRPGSRRRLLALAETGEERQFRIAAGGDIGTGGNAVWLDSALTFMCPDGTTTEGLVFVETDAEGLIRGCCLLPLGPVEPRRDYALVEVDRGNARARLAEIACAFFARGTRIALADGS